MIIIYTLSVYIKFIHKKYLVQKCFKIFPRNFDFPYEKNGIFFYQWLYFNLPSANVRWSLIDGIITWIRGRSGRQADRSWTVLSQAKTWGEKWSTSRRLKKGQKRRRSKLKNLGFQTESDGANGRVEILKSKLKFWISRTKRNWGKRLGVLRLKIGSSVFFFQKPRISVFFLRKL